MPNRSSIRGRDGLYYRIPDFDEFDDYDNFNAPAYGKDLADELQFSDLDPSIRLLLSGTAMRRADNDEDSYRLPLFADMGNQFSPANTGVRLMARDDSMPTTDAGGFGREYLQASTPARSWLLNTMSNNGETNSESFAAQNLAPRNTGLLSRFDTSTPQEYSLGIVSPDDLQEGNSTYTPYGREKLADDDSANFLPDYSLGASLTERIRPEDVGSLPLQRDVSRLRGMPVLTREEVERGVNIPIKIDDLLSNAADLRFAPRTHTIQRGDNPSQLGKQYFNDGRAGMSILAQNGLATSADGARNLPVGRVLTIPNNITNANLRAGGQLIAADTSERRQAIELAQRQRVEQSNAQVSFGNGVRQHSRNELISSFKGIKEGIMDVGRHLKEKHGGDTFSKGFDQNSIYITTYADINKKNPELGWTGLAPFASNEVRAALAWLAKRSLRNRGESVEGKYFLSATPDRGLDSSSMPGMAFDNLAKGNQQVFEDITPYLRFYQQHGAAKLLSIANDIGMKDEMREAFEALQASQETKDPERAEILRAISAKKMLNHEQRNVLQEMYKKPMMSGGAWINGATGSRILPLDVHVGQKGEPGYFEISPTDKSIDLSNINERWAYASTGLDQFTNRYNNPATREITRQQIQKMADPRNLHPIPVEIVPHLKISK
ncbi:LysM peptidoglycan-binding domain-containing protein [Undibacterium umbellatum]|uniref:LysM peptidoglycan-binding domain-containing protein n=1 Tax=Undibacterium umbellatum TaxID=2762300 RepID=A0ABR6Z8C2_9BURK|nr:LysM peptidoglycan-binding domain-containing protein [Undibacterium umbellatum]MBC3908032.1 LysM peptidoglycan-binding domain-containing protein [Undibacterium umbellatum]